MFWAKFRPLLLPALSMSLHLLVSAEIGPPGSVHSQRQSLIQPRTQEGRQIRNAVYNLSCCTRWAEQTQPSHTPGATSLHGWHRLTLRYFPGVCPRMMRLSLLCMCQMNHKPIPYAIAICWWAQAVLVDIKSRDYRGLILSEWRERRTERPSECEGKGDALSVCFSIGPRVSDCRKVGRQGYWSTNV